MKVEEPHCIPFPTDSFRVNFTTSLGMCFKMYHGALQISYSKSGLIKGAELAINH